MTRDERWLLTEKYGGVKTPDFSNDQKRIAGGEPLGYVIGWVPFLNCKIWLDSQPLIPRPETEFWVELVINQIAELQTIVGQNDVKVLDLCAGSGCIGVAVAKALPKVQVDLAEINPIHLPTIRKNLAENLSIYRKVFSQYNVIQSDLFANILDQYDFILSNPPYIDPVLDRTETAVKNYEPHQALYGGTDGVELITQIIATAPLYLKPTGQLWLEHEPEQVDAINLTAEQNNFLATTHTDQYNIPRYSRLTMAK